MKIAVTSSYADNNVFGHFGKCEVFKVYEIADGKVASKISVPTNGQGHSQLTGFLKGIGADVVICSGMGQGAYSMLTEGGLKVVRGAKGDIDEAVNAYLNGSLTDNTAAVCSHHHDHDHSHNCSCGEHHCH